MKLFSIFFLLLSSMLLYSQGKQEYINAVNSKINYENASYSMKGGLIYDNILDEYKFISVFQIPNEKYSLICKPFTKFDIEDISMVSTNKFLIKMQGDKCNHLIEINGIEPQFKKMDGIIIMLDDNTSNYQGEKFLEVLRNIFK